jgi:hypothetical protein
LAGDEGTVELAVVMMAVFFLLSVGLVLGVRWFAAEASSAAAQRGLEIAQSPGGTEEEVRQVAVALATSSRIVNDVDVVIVRGGESVTVRVTTVPVIGGDVSKSATGPLLRFIPQQERR